MLRRRTLLKQTIVGDLNTKLLLHFDGSVVDASPYSVPVSAEAGTSFATGRFVSKGIKVIHYLIIYRIFTTQKIKII